MLYLPEANSFHPAKAKVRPFWLAAAMHRRLYLSAGSPVCERDAGQTVAKAMRFYKGTCVGEVPVIGTKGDRVATDHVFVVRVSLCITRREFVSQFHLRSRTGFVEADIRTLRLMNLTTRAKAMDIGRRIPYRHLTIALASQSAGRDFGGKRTAATSGA